ncbi:MAG: HEAT repeat domain-containing protein, partial [Nostoc sp.]|uniref:HEAT repeat domain-containing protein n=1 Tax=Nostoc sp. TaxID=1180 RepID=UPI002FF914E7
MAERRKLTTNPLTSTEGVALQVDDVYLPLGLVERKKQSKRQGDISPEQGSELYKETEITKTFEHDAFLEEVLKQKNTPKSQGKRIAIIGEPGAGKTTRLQQIADWVSREIDQSIVIWVSLADLRGQELKSYLFESWLTQVAEKTGKAEATKQLKDDFVALFNQNNVWLLLDGLDEMSASSDNPLTEIARQFREVGSISQARIVLTCRVNLWDGSINALDDFDTYRSLDFSYPEQVERFIDKWFNKIEIPEKGKKLCTVLKESGNKRIQDLIKNPLRLTLLCLNWQSGDGKLPDTQAGLYQQFVDDFYKWKKEEFATNYDQRQQLNIKLGELAREAIDKEATRFRLRQDFVNRFLGDADDEKSLLKLALNRGWLNCVGIDTDRKPVYAFFHASFQEYFAAKAIDDWHFFLNHVPKNPSQGTYRIFEPQWKQTILLWLGRKNLAKEQKEAFIQALVEFDDRCGNWHWRKVDKGFYEYQAYFIAAAGITEFGHCSRTDEIVNQIVKWGFGYFKTKKQKWLTFLDPIEKEARTALYETERTKAITTLIQLLESTDADNNTHLQAAYSLGQIGAGNKQTITALEQLFKSTNVDERTRGQAAVSLWEIDPGNKKAISALVQLLESADVDYIIHEIDLLAPRRIYMHYLTCGLAAHSLGQIDPGNEQAIAALVNLLASTDSVQRLRETYTDEPTRHMATEFLLPFYIYYENIRRLAAECLWQIDPSNEQVITVLVRLLESTKTNSPWEAAESLGLIDPGNEKAINTLVNLVESTDVNDLTRWQSAESLGEIGCGNQKAMTALVNLVESTDVNDLTRWQSAESLGEIGCGNQK